MELSVPKLAEKEGGTETCRGVFIRAPAILEVGPNVEVIANCPLSSAQPKVMIPSVDGKEVFFYKLYSMYYAILVSWKIV
jgi:pyridoxal 5'-phosphate synthase pdxT subunit